MATGLDDMQALIGRAFPGGSYFVERWENVLLHDVVEFPPAPDGLLHPIALFHVPLAACGWTYSEIFAICGAESAEAVRAGEYEWELLGELREQQHYDVTGEFVAVERKQGRRGGVFDAVTFRLDLSLDGDVVARVSNTWLFLRSSP